MDRIITYFFRRPMVMNLFMVLLMASAAFAYWKTNRLGFPRVELARLYIDTTYPGATASDVELDVTEKIEDAIREIDGVDTFESTSIENFSRIQVNIDDSHEELQDVIDDIRRALDGVTDLPREVMARPKIIEEKVDSLPIYEIGIFPKTNAPLTVAVKDRLRHQARELKRLFLKIPSIAKVEFQGQFEPELKVKLDLSAMGQFQIGVNEVIRVLQENKFRVTGGEIDDPQEQFRIVTTSDFSGATDLEKLVIRANPLGEAVTLADVASLEEGYEKQDVKVFNNGRRGISIFVMKVGSADILDAVAAIKKVHEDYQPVLASEGLASQIMFDMAVNTDSRLDTVYNNAGVGFLLVLAVLLLFLNHRVALWTAFGIPLATCIALCVMYPLGITINSISLVGMVVVLGMLVDDAIIIAECIQSGMEEGLTGIDAARRGLRQVFWPVLVTIITTVMAFMPMYFLPGDAGRFAIEVPTIVTVMLAASFFEATTILPVHVAHADKGKGSNRQPIGARLITLVLRFYANALAWVLRHKWLAIPLMAMYLWSGYYLGVNHTNFKMFPVEEAFQIMFYGEVPSTYSSQQTAEVTQKLEEIIRSMPQAQDILVSYKTQVGLKSMWANNNGVRLPNGFTTRIILVPRNQRSINAESLKDWLWQKYMDKDAGLGAIKSLDYYIDGGGPFAGKPVEIDISGNNDAKRAAAAAALKAQLSKLPLSEIEDDITRGRREMTFIPDRHLLARTSLSGLDVGYMVRAAYEGLVVNDFRRGEDRVAVRLELAADSRHPEQPLAGLLVQNPRGQLIDLGRLVRSDIRETQMKILRLDGYRSTKITANIKEAETTPVKAKQQLEPLLERLRQDFPMLTIKLGGEAQKDSETLLDLFLAIAVAVVAVYCLLVVQFNSFVQPLMVLTAIPFGLVGVVAAFSFHGYNLSMLAMIGIMGFAGVVVNNSLLMVEFINRERQKGSDAEAIIAGASNRLRPILLTTISTVAGLLPTAYGWIGGFDSFVSPMVLAMAWGLTSGTATVLFVIPVLYDILAGKQPNAGAGRDQQQDHSERAA